MIFYFQSEIRDELSKMSFEELQKLKEKIGTKAYNATMFSNKNKKDPKKIKTEFKRENKNRPVEMGAKKPVSRFREIVSIKKSAPRDPRFDASCGTFNELAFKHAYSFITDVQKNDIKKLQKELKKTDDPEEITKIKFLIQRLQNKLREKERKEVKEEKMKEEKKEIKEALKMGKKPVIIKKCKFKFDFLKRIQKLTHSFFY